MIHRAYGVALAALAFGLSACEVKCHLGGASSATEDVETAAGAKLTAMAGVPITVDCPELKLEGTQQCSGHAHGVEPFPVSIRFDNLEDFNLETAALMGSWTTEALQLLFPGIDVASIRCPAVIPSGTSGTCEARIDGVSLSFGLRREGTGVNVDDPGGRFLRGPQMAEEITQKLAAAGVQATVDCGPAIRAVAIGSRTECSARVGDKNTSISVLNATVAGVEYDFRDVHRIAGRAAPSSAASVPNASAASAE